MLLTKADKLGRAEAAATLKAATAAAGPEVTVQLFSATTGDGVEAARPRLRQFLKA